MPKGRVQRTDRTLLERDRELEDIDGALDGAVAGDGWLLLLEGAAGIGKTALLEQARARAERGGLTVLQARGGELERDFPYGVARQLFESTVRAASVSRRRRLLAGAAGLAGTLLLGGEPGASAPTDASFAVLHGLYWLVANLAVEAPVALVIDDAHWSDAASLRFLIYLARRLDGQRVALIVSLRTGEGGPIDLLLAELEATRGAAVLTPASLSDAAVARMLADDFRCEPDQGFVRACREATGGNPFLVHELAASLIADDIEPSAQAALSVAAVGPRTVARASLGRLGHLSEDAVVLARAIAVLGSDARLPRAVRLTGLAADQATAALDVLVAAALVPRGGQLEFSHPIVRAAVYNEVSPGERSSSHRRIAELLAAEGADVDAVAGHLLLSQPIGSLETIEVLRDAASHALAVGAPDSATTYLARALAEGCERELRMTLLMELASAQQLARNPAAIEHLEEVRNSAGDPVMRARAAIDQAMILLFSGEWQRPKALMDDAIADIGERDAALSLRAEAVRTGMVAYDPRLIGDLGRRLPSLRERATRGDAAGRPLAMLLAALSGSRGEPRDQVCALVERGWDEGRLLNDGGGHELLPQALLALLFYDELDRAEEIAAELRADAGRRGSLTEFLMASTAGAGILARRGDLVAAEAELRAGCEGALEHGVLFAIPTLLWCAVDVLTERPETGDLAALAETIDLGPMAEVLNGALVLEVRGRLRYAAGNRAGAVADLRRVGTMFSALGFTNPNAFAWRSTLALMLAPAEHDEAIELVAGELTDARRVGLRRGIGVALRAFGVIEGGDAGRAQLGEAVTTLAASRARLEHARALIDLGASARRQGHPNDARLPLREGLELASRCGAGRLVERARTELAATGAKPRRHYVTSRDALTPSELRVARLAADGRTNQEIAQALFVTTKTIDSHLQHSYTKLGINSRKQLAHALEQDGQGP